MAVTYEPIASQTLGADAASVTFSDLPTTYADLVLIVFGNNTTSGSGTNSLQLRFNSDTGSNYSATNLGAYSAGAFSARETSQTAMSVGQISQTSASPATNVISIMSYANANVNKTVLGNSAASTEYVTRYVGMWRSTAAITSLTVRSAANNLKSGATFSLYGIKAA